MNKLSAVLIVSVIGGLTFSVYAGTNTNKIVSFKDAAKIKSWDAWSDHVGPSIPREKPCITWRKLNQLDPGMNFVGRLKTRSSKEIPSSRWSIGCETMDRDYADWNAYKNLLSPLGVKHGRLFSGWAKTEQEKGVYDFTWLDVQVREMAAMSIKPWICLSYGNPVWGSDFRLGMRVKQVTDNPEAFQAWIRYCTACVNRYKDVVDEWEIWNEPFGQAVEYAEMFYRTAKAIRAIQPTAKCYVTAINWNGWHPEKSDYAVVLERLKKENALDLASYFIYHPYHDNPDCSYAIIAEPLREFVKKYDKRFDIMQGEVGCPSQLEFAHAMCNIEWTEYSQAKWNLRRTIGDAARDIPCNVFTMIDLQYTFMLQSFGMVRSNTLKEFVYRRPSYFAMQNVFSLFDDNVKLERMDTKAPFTQEYWFDVRASRPHVLTSMKFKRGEKPFWLFWFAEARPTNVVGFDRVTLPVWGTFKQPVWVEMITGRVFEIPKTSYTEKEGITTFRYLPMWDSPVMIVEKQEVVSD